ncbi:hypothetical protein B566_EDAN009186 [Ephemera danica]|nr:hypothetical protein B566_EDAN009186 [Ephemera danica]
MSFDACRNERGRCFNMGRERRSDALSPGARAQGEACTMLRNLLLLALQLLCLLNHVIARPWEIIGGADLRRDFNSPPVDNESRAASFLVHTIDFIGHPDIVAHPFPLH